MSTTPDPAPAPETPAQETDWKAEYEKVKAEARKWEERAKANKDAADRLAELETSSAEAIQEAIQRAEAAEAALAPKDAEIVRLTTAVKHRIDAEHLDLLVGSDEAELEAKAQKLAALIATDPKGPSIGPYVPPEGTSPAGDLSTTADKFAEAVSRALP